MPLGDAHVERALGEGLHQEGHGAARGHGGGHPHDALVFLRQLHQGMPEHVLIELGLVQLMDHDALARLLVEPSRRVPLRGRLLGGLEALSLLGLDVQELRALQVLDIVQHLDEIVDVVPVHGAEVTDAEALEQVVLAREQGLQAIVEAQDVLAPVVVDQVHLPQAPIDVVAHLVVGLARGDIHQVLAQAAHAMVDGHIIVVQDNQQVVRVDGGVVQPLEGQASRHRPVADDRDHVAIRLFPQGGGHGHTHRRGDGVGGVPGDERVVLALGRVGEPADAPQLPQGMEYLFPPRQDLVAIVLVPHVPHDAVVRRVEHVMKGHGKLHRPQAGPQVTGVLREHVDDILTQLRAHRLQLVRGKGPQILRYMNAI